MRVLVTGGTGVVGTGVVTELLKRDHTVVLLSRHANDDARQWDSGVTPRIGDVTDATSLHGAADGCDAVLHAAGIVEEVPPDTTFARVNVEGTTHLLAEAERAHVPRFVYVSSLGAPAGQSGYHKSKCEAENAVRRFHGAWTICRPGNVYGPGDEQISLMLRIVRGASPVVPKVGDGDQPFQPVWWEDIARALADVVERDEFAGEELDLAGAEVTSQNDLLARFSAITGRHIYSVTVPEFMATVGAKAVSLVGWDLSFNDDQLQMLREGNVVPEGATNALTERLGITPTPLDEGLRKLADLQPEQLPSEGIGSLVRKRFWADITDCQHSPDALFEILRKDFSDVTPVFVDVDAEPESPREIHEGEVLTLALPMRGHVQVRVTDLRDRQVTLLTLMGHPLAGAVRFACEPRGSHLRFQVEVYDRAANLLDFIAMRTLGDHLQNHTWERVVESMVERSGGEAPEGVQRHSESLSPEEADAVCKWLEDLTVERKRAEHREQIQGTG
jgi:NADH dehydrogenase